MRHLIPAALVAAALSTAGCMSNLPDLPDVSMPASMEDLEQLRTDSDAADAQIRQDVQAARDAGRAAYDQAIAEGMTQTEALIEQYRAEAGAAGQLAAQAEEKAEDAKASAGEGGVEWYEALIGVLGTIVASILGTNAVRDRRRRQRGEPVAPSDPKPSA